MAEDASWAATGAWRELMQDLQEFDRSFLEGDRAVTDEQSVVEGYKFLATIFATAMDVFVFADAPKPRFVDVVTPDRMDRRWGGDNTDAYYMYAPIDPARTYRVTGVRGDSVYFSLTVYNEPEPGQWSDRVVGIVNDSDLAAGPGGPFELLMGPQRPANWSGAFIELTPDAAAAITRDYQVDPATARRTTFHIEAVDSPSSYRERDETMTRGLRRAPMDPGAVRARPSPHRGSSTGRAFPCRPQSARGRQHRGPALPGARRQLRMVGA